MAPVKSIRKSACAIQVTEFPNISCWLIVSAFADAMFALVVVVVLTGGNIVKSCELK